MKVTRKQLRKLIRESVEENRIEGLSSIDVYHLFNPRKWDDVVNEITAAIAPVIVRKIFEGQIEYDINKFISGARQGWGDATKGVESNPKRHAQSFHFMTLDQMQGYKWGYENYQNWDGQDLPEHVLKAAIEEEMREFESHLTTSVIAQSLYDLFMKINPVSVAINTVRIIREAYRKGGIKGLLGKPGIVVMTIVVMEILDNAVLPVLFINLGLPPVTFFFGSGDIITPLVIDKLAKNESQQEKEALYTILKSYERKYGSHEGIKPTQPEEEDPVSFFRTIDTWRGEEPVYERKLTRSQLRRLIREALQDVRYASRTDDGYQFSSQLPSTAQEELGQEILAGVGDVETLRNFFKDSLVDVNIIVVPDNVYQGMITALANKLGISLPDIFEADLDNSLINKGLNWLTSKFRGLSKELGQVRAELSPDAYNMIIQRKDRKEASAFLFDLSWITHDLIGHAFNFSGMSLSSVIDGLTDLFTLGAAPTVNPLTIGGTFDQTLKIADRSMIGKSAVDKTIQSSLIADFEKENFTPGVRDIDLGASVIGYYFLKGVFPPTIVDAAASGVIDQEALGKMEEVLVTAMQGLRGKTGFVNFGDLIS